MKMYIAQDGVRLVGKAWEVRHKLKEMSQTHSKKTLLAQLVSGPAHPVKYEGNRR
jgi:spore germination cell wall hydrolase CwlJ-like protein